jgi:predicted phage gp36 major capsid-like protein
VLCPEPSLIPGERFVKAGVAAAVGAAQIATIAKTQFNGGNNNITQPTLASGGAGASPVGFTQNLNNTQIPTTKVIVTETDIRRATRNIDGIYNKAVVVE